MDYQGYNIDPVRGGNCGQVCFAALLELPANQGPDIRLKDAPEHCIREIERWSATNNVLITAVLDAEWPVLGLQKPLNVVACISDAPHAVLARVSVSVGSGSLVSVTVYADPAEADAPLAQLSRLSEFKAFFVVSRRL